MMLQLLVMAAVGPCGGIQLVSGEVRTGEVLRPDAPDACLSEIGKRLASLPRLRSVTIAARVTDDVRGKGGGLPAAKRAASVVATAGVSAELVSVVAPRTEAAEQPSLSIAYLQAPRGLPVARLRTASGPVTSTSPGGEPQPLAVGSDLYLQDQVATGDGVVADVALVDGSAIRLMPRSTVRVIAAEGAGARRKVLLELIEGELVSNVESTPETSFEIRSQTAIAGVRGTNFRSVAGTAGLRIETLGGAVNLASAGQAVDVPSGKGALAPPGAPPGRPVDLPGPPVVRRPLAGTVAAPVMLEWDGSKTADHRLELARDADFVEGYRQLRVKGVLHQLTGVERGRWFWRVAAIARDGFVGRPSKTYAFNVQ